MLASFYEQARVEDRLQLYVEKYDNKRMERMKDQSTEECSQLKNPEINPISEKIVANMPVTPLLFNLIPRESQK